MNAKICEWYNKDYFKDLSWNFLSMGHVFFHCVSKSSASPHHQPPNECLEDTEMMERKRSLAGEHLGVNIIQQECRNSSVPKRKVKGYSFCERLVKGYYSCCERMRWGWRTRQGNIPRLNRNVTVLGIIICLVTARSSNRNQSSVQKWTECHIMGFGCILPDCNF